MIETDVLVVGGGPTGLATALELGRRGVRCMLVEPRTTVSLDRPRAKTTSVRTMEHFRRWGLADRLRDAALLPVAWSQDVVFCTGLVGAEITRFHGAFGLEPDRVDLFAESGQQIPQPFVEQVLRAALADLDQVTVHYGWRAETVVERDAHVDVGLRDPAGAPVEARARYVVGCDGPTGVVRSAIGARYDGSSDSRSNLNLLFRAPGLADLVPHGPAVHYWVINQELSGVLGRFDLADTWWCGLAGDVTDPLPLVRKLIGADVPVEVRSVDHWTPRMLCADRFAGERVFLAGDAAHLNPPWGGHGFNTGVGDAVNVGWKIAAALAGWAGPGLLSSYAAERRGLAERTIATSAAHLRRAPRDLTGGAADIQRHKESEFHSLGLVLGYQYRDSPIVSTEDTPVPAERTEHYEPTGRPGARLPHAWLPDGRSLYDVLGPDHTLLCFTGEADPTPFAHAAAERGMPLTIVDLTGVLPVSHCAAPLVLVRPDQHVSWRGGNASPGTVLDRAAGWSGA
jgi:2-polyprenyl-6-methoxyphenol hydroxylase-like FAD-dependent oxidoreductase